MCYANPTKSLELARARLTPDEWAKFEREFEVFCVTSGLHTITCEGYWWTKWAFFSARPREEKTEPREHCQCPACINGTIHASDCAVHNAPALPIGECDCGITPTFESLNFEHPATRELMRTDWFPCTISPCGDGWYEVQRNFTNGQPIGAPELVPFKCKWWNHHACESGAPVWASSDYWRGVTEESK